MVFSFLKTLWVVFFFLSFCNVSVQSADIDAIDKVVVEKHKRLLCLLSKGKIIKSYKIALGFEPKGHKRIEGGGKTPEGIYKIDWRQHSKKFHKSLHISYPDRKDKANAQEKRRPPGGAIMIHGLGKFNFLGKLHLKKDWTLGCIAVTNEEVSEIWDLVPNGTPIEILP